MLIYKLVGYDRETESLAVEHVIPAQRVANVKTIAGISARPEIIGDWPLSRDQARDIGQIIGVSVDLDRYDWSLEPDAPPIKAERLPV